MASVLSPRTKKDWVQSRKALFFKENYKKKLPKSILPSKVWFFAVEQHGMMDPFAFVDDEKYLQTLMVWKKRELKKFIEDNPRLSIREYRHEKICSYREPLRV